MLGFATYGNRICKECLNLKQPQNFLAFRQKDIEEAVQKIGFPMIVRPSYVLGGQAMEVIYIFFIHEFSATRSAARSSENFSVFF